MNEELDLSLENVVKNTHSIVSMLTMLSGKFQELFGPMSGGRADGAARPRKVEWHWANYGFTVHIKFEVRADIISVMLEVPPIEHQTPWLSERLAKAQRFIGELNKSFGGG